MPTPSPVGLGPTLGSRPLRVPEAAEFTAGSTFDVRSHRPMGNGPGDGIMSPSTCLARRAFAAAVLFWLLLVVAPGPLLFAQSGLSPRLRVSQGYRPGCHCWNSC